MGKDSQPKSDGGFKFGFKDSFSSKTKYAVIAVVIIIFSFLMYITANTITGLATYSNEQAAIADNMKNELNASIAAAQLCRQNLERKAEQLGSCSNKFISERSKAAECDIMKNNFMEQKNQLNDRLASCQGNVSEFESLSKSFKSIISDSIKNICCTPGNEIVSWNIEDDKIVCIGDRTLNCVTGETI